MTGCDGSVRDVIVIGAGMAGGMAARRLSELGARVLVLEAAAPDPGETAPPSAMSRIGARLAGRHVVADPDRWQEQMESSRGKAGPRLVPAMLGRGRGGSSAIYGGALGRFRRIDFERDGARDARVDPAIGAAPLPGAWPVGFDAFKPYYAQAEALLDMAGSRDPLDPESAAPSRRPPPLSPQDAAIARGLQAAGLHPYRLPVGFRYRPGCAECLGRRCMRGCKAEGDSRGIAVALRTGRTSLLQGMAVRSIAVSDGLVSVAARDPGGAEHRFLGRACVLAAGALNTPLILGRSPGLWKRDRPPPLLGRGLMFHVSDMFAVFERSRAPAFGPRKTLGFRDFYEIDGLIHGEVQSMGVALNTGLIASFLKNEAERMGLGGLGPLLELTRIPAMIAARLFGGAAIFATILEDLPYHANSVGEGAGGDPRTPSPTGRIAVSYTVSAELRARAAAMRRMLRPAFAPNRVMFLTRPATPNWGHPMGTCRMGDSPGTGMIGPDGALWDHPMIRIADASALPSSGGTNPALTVAANALRVSDLLVASLALPPPVSEASPADDA